MGGWRCAGCGGENVEGTRFCGHCGAPGGAQAPSTTPSTTPSDAERRLRSFVGGPVAERLEVSDGRLAEERRLVTALFADISGFTALAQQLDPEELHEVVDPLVTRLTDVAGRHGAFVEKFAGDALLAVFGAPVAHEDDADRALLTALEMHRELLRARRDLPPAASTMTLHVGINSGHGIARVIGSEARMDYGVLGDAVILAQRLESQAPAGDTYVGAATVGLLRGRFALEPAGSLTLKGIAEPVEAWRLLGPASALATVHATAPAVLVGRQLELARLTAALRGAAGGRGGILLVEGEPGAGKSSLVEAARGELGPDARWLQTRCVAYGASLPYRPLAELLRAYAGIRLDDLPEAASRLLATALAVDHQGIRMPALARVLGVAPTVEDLALAGGDEAVREAARIDGLEPEALRRSIHEAVARWLGGLARETPLVVAIEDAHWLDSASADLLLDLAGRLGGTSVAVVVTARTDGLGASQRALDRAAEAGVARASIALGPLDPAEIGELARSELGGEAPSRLVTALAERASGNPLFVVETLRTLRERGSLVRDADHGAGAGDGADPTGAAWRLTADWDPATVPPTIEGILGERIDRLPPATAFLLAQASVVGRRVRGPVLRAVADADGLEARLDQLVETGFLDRVLDAGHELLVFHHALAQDVAYGRLLRRQRRDLHLQVADAVESIYGSSDDVIDLLARHLYLAGAGERAVDALAAAADRARRLFAHDEALASLERAEELARGAGASADRLADVLLAEAELLDLRGDYERAAARFGEVRAMTNRVAAWTGEATIARRTGRYDDAFALLGAALEALPADADRRPVLLERSATLGFAGHFEASAGAALAGLALRDRTAPGQDDDRVTGRLLLQLAAAEARIPGREDDALEHATAAGAIFRRVDDPSGLVAVYRATGMIHWGGDRLEAAADALAAGLVLAERIGGVEEVGGTLVNLGLVELALGRTADAVATDRRAVAEFGRVGHASGLMVATANLAEALVAVGELAEAETMAVAALELADQLDDPRIVADVERTQARGRLAAGDTADALRLAELAGTAFEAFGEPDEAATCWILAAAAATALGDAGRARALEQRARSTGR